ncbi:MAG: OsmC family protein [archaeon GB-1867-035]|nr:OsmC family protein [Candidatus Culexmicrobium profundum]
MSELEVKLKLVRDVGFIGQTASRATVILKAPSMVVEAPIGISSMELVLIALAGCTAWDIVTILDKMKQKFDGLEVHVKGKRRSEVPRIYTDIHVHYVVYGEVDEEKLKKAIELSQKKYCSVSIMLKNGGVNIITSYEVKAK